MAAIDSSISIEDPQGQLLFGVNCETHTAVFPLILESQTVGWLKGSAQAAPLAPLLICILKQETQKKLLAQELLERYQEIDLFEDLSTQITTSLNLTDIAQLAIAELETLIPATSGAIFIVNPQTQTLDTLAQFGQAYAAQDYLHRHQELVQQVTQMQQGSIINDVPKTWQCSSCSCAFQSLIYVPLKAKKRTIGLIAIGNETPSPYNTEHLKLLSIFAGQIAIAIEKALLYQTSQTVARQAQAQAQELQQALQELKQTQAKLVQSEKMSSLGHTIAGVAHEINNPIGFVSGNLTLLQDYSRDLCGLLALYEQYYPDAHPVILDRAEEIDLEFLQSDLGELVQSMNEGIKRIKEIVLSLRNFSRIDHHQAEAVDLHQGIDSTLMILRHRLKIGDQRPAIEVLKDYGELPLVSCYAGQLNQVFMNILSNAIDALDQHATQPQIRIQTRLLDSEQVAITIADNGSGMPPELIDQIYEPFFTTKSVGKGTGLGMAISQQVVAETHGGHLDCTSQLGVGTEFCITLPICLSAVSDRPTDLRPALLYPTA
ncbi:MAG: GAF domain-containing protein [Spirulina sp. SIO3F2]|nr:GAF domain-containing protein [Spirulina sp. SIO3F2]